MQVIHPTPYSPEHYKQIQGHRQTRAKECCPCCGKAAVQHRHGDYGRWVVSRSGEPLLIRIARFLCMACGRTSSYLPSFALTYRLLSPGTLEAYLKGEYAGVDVQRYWELLRRYTRQMTGFAPSMVGLVGMGLGPAPPVASAASAGSVLSWLEMACGDLEIATGRLVQTFRLGIFGSYKCHL